MRFRTLAVAAVILALAATAALAAFEIGQDARAEAAQQTIERNDSLAVDPAIRQKLVSDTDHDPTAYGANGTERVEFNGTVWEPDGNYTYFPSDGEIEFQRNESQPANVTYQYDIPADQTLDEQGQTATESFALVMRFAIGAAFVVLFLFVGGFVARRINTTGGRGR